MGSVGSERTAVRAGKIPDANDPRLAALEDLLASHTFLNRPRLRSFLEFVGKQTLAGATDRLKESNLAVEVFGRDAGRHSSDDNIVRVTARHLRAALEEYYRSEGRESEWIISLPRGGYAVRFDQRDAVQPPAVRTKATGDSEGRQPKAVSPRLAWLLVTILTGALFGVITWYQPGPRPETLLGLVFPGGNGKVLLVVRAERATSAIRSELGRYPTLDQFREFVNRGTLPGLRSGVDSIAPNGVLNVVSPSDLNVAVAIAHQFPPGTLRPRLPSQLDGTEFHEESAILLGGPYTNPWVQLFEDRLNFQVEETDTREVIIRNRNPLPGESQEYKKNTSDGQRRGYCRIAYLPNLSGNHSVLLIGGLCEGSFTALPSSLVESAFLGEIRKRLGVRANEKTPFFEVLLQTSERGNVSVSRSIFMVRRVVDQSASAQTGQQGWRSNLAPGR
jgi:hypothetical protein